MRANFDKLLEAADERIACDGDLYSRLVALRGGCRCCISPPCFACCDQLTLEEADILGLLEDLADTTECTRPPLTWATPKPVDRFPGFTVERFDADDLMPAGPDYDHPLQRMTDPSDPLHGSAFLR